MRSRVKSSICPVILRPAKNCKFLTAFSICWCDRILSAKFDLGRQPNCIRQSSTFLLQSIIELTTCLHEFPEYESTNFFTNISQFLNKIKTNLLYYVWGHKLKIELQKTLPSAGVYRDYYIQMDVTLKNTFIKTRPTFKL